MRYWYEALPALKEAMAAHFPDAEPAKIASWADEIFDSNSAAASLERFVRGDTLPDADIKNIEAATKSLRLAAKKLECVGWHGNKSLLESAKEIRKMSEALPGEPLLDTMNSSVYLAEFLRGLSNRLGECAKEIVPHGASVMSAFDEDAERKIEPGAKRKTEAHSTAGQAYHAFEALAGKTPTVATDASNGRAYGPFLDFISNVFDCLAVEASPETWARKIIKEKNRS